MKIFAVLLSVLMPVFLFAQPYQGTPGKQKVEIPAKAAGCAPPTSSTYLQLNNVRALIHTAGNLWQVPGQNFSQYEVPKNSGIMALFTSALWLGGTDANGQLKLAALRYRNGQDYWTGPLTEITANTTSDNCLKYDKHFVTTQDEIREFNAWYETGLADAENGTNNQSTLFPNYTVPDIIKEWPAHGDVSQGQDYYLAPFFDRNEDGNYNYLDGDYPWHDINKTKDCKTDKRVSLYGDLNFWWVMNDKGNIHTETNAEPIGMEIRAQAFAFASNDEVNNMTFYNYELINRGTQTLFDTYFGYFTDGALGDPYDDYVGCDVSRGLAYYYNGDNLDANNGGFFGYGDNPPAVGVDFFEGPYQDDDGIDNAFGIEEGEALNGIGYGDGIVDNERYGMRRFLYYSNTTNGANPNQTDPIGATDYYNYLRGFWKDGTPFYYGGSGHLSDPDADQSVPCDFMFPGDTDPLGWGTGGVPQTPWTEQTAGNTPNDRRFLQSAGPFVLKPGAVNNITVGVVWARATAGDPFASVEILRRADDKAQALFENCFKVLDGPHAPELEIQELQNELILTIYNPVNSNNYGEEYTEKDPFIVSEDSTADKTYRFQGYQIYQLKDNSVSSSDLKNPQLARQVAQCDIKDGIGRLINFEFDEVLQASVPIEYVDGTDAGIRHSFSVKNDLFAQGDSRLVNFKRYYYMAISYAYNNYETYNPDDPTAIDGQKKVYLASRKAAIGEIRPIEGIPHDPAVESGGLLTEFAYGDGPEITRLDGTGSNFTFLDLTPESIRTLLNQGQLDELTYARSQGPIELKIIDPLNVAPGYFECAFRSYTEIDTASWVVYRYDKRYGNLLDSVSSDKSIQQDNEQLIPQWGVSLRILQHKNYQVGSSGPTYTYFADPIGGSINFADSAKQWLGFVSDNDQFFPTNWIRSGTFHANADETDPSLGIFNPACYNDRLGKDPEKEYPKLIDGGIAPFCLVGTECDFMPVGKSDFFASGILSAQNQATLPRIGSVDIVLTSDRSKWTRCPVIELCRDENLSTGNARAGTLRRTPSIGKNRQPLNDGTYGMSWFPGYAIDVNTGYRLHMAFGENSFLVPDNGNDLIWNPTERLTDPNGNPILGGQHPIYVFGVDINNTGCPYYSESNTWLYDHLMDETLSSYRDLYSNLSWVVNPLLNHGHELLSTDVTLKVRINKEFQEYAATGENNGRPKYAWNMNDSYTEYDQSRVLADELKNIRVVPNPYNARSGYEPNKLDTRVKITNLPYLCTVRIYTVSGKLIKTFKKDSPQTFIDWTLTNEQNIPISGGTYLIHVEVPDVGSTVLKAFIVMRQTDLQDF